APHIVHPFNYGYCFENLLQAELLVGGVARHRLHSDPAAIVAEILGPQQELVTKKAKSLTHSKDPQEMENGHLALALIQRSRDLRSIRDSGVKLLYPSEYRVRADDLVVARRLVGGVEIETPIEKS
ncbi:MAG: hypothetical protein ACWGMZ_03095, partial [Thermoguttaceae bacterium]